MSIKSRIAMRNQRSIFQISFSNGTAILHRKNGIRFKPSPSHTENQRVIAFQNFGVPSMFQDAAVNKSECALTWEETAQNEGFGWLEVFDKFDRDVGNLDSDVAPWSRVGWVNQMSFLKNNRFFAQFLVFFYLNPSNKTLFSSSIP